MKTLPGHHLVMPGRKRWPFFVAGGQAAYSATATAELYDPVMDTWSEATPLATPRMYHTATVLPSGEVLAVGGMTGLNAPIVGTAELYAAQPGPAGSPCVLPVGCQSGFCVDGVCCEKGCDASASSRVGGSSGAGGAGGAGGSGSPPVTVGGCGCRAAGSSEDAPFGATALLALAAGLAFARRRSTLRKPAMSRGATSITVIAGDANLLQLSSVVAS